MEKLTIEQMTFLNGGELACSAADRVAFIAGSATAGALFFGAGGFITGYAAFLYQAHVCDNAFANMF